jgi:ABC-type lipoprotein export system ATPase subunit
VANHAVGSIWRRWDLHVHTPASVVQKYGGDTEDAWERFVRDLESLPPEFAVIGVNDYLFIDGYKKLLQFKAAGRLANIETLLPVIEFRLSKFAGHDKMLRVNYHVIFSEALRVETIESQFLVQLGGKLNVSAEHASLRGQWRAAITRESLTDLGRLIRADMPPNRVDELEESDFLLGVNNLNVDDGEIAKLLHNSYLRGKYVDAIGKAEWDQYRWTDNSIAEKKNAINSVRAVFTAAPDMAAFARGRDRLIRERVNPKLLDCSDAHALSESEDKDRVGNCLTWIKGDPTLDGLILALRDYEDRVFVGPRPPLLEDIDRHPAKYIRRARVRKRDGHSPAGKWFDDVDLQLNPELIAVIGNRGMGKSALMDAVALAGNSPRPAQDLSFLKPFQAARGGLADSFEAVLDWYTEEPSGPVPLSTSHDATRPSRVKHLPQRFIELVCNDEDDKFEKEIERVVFSHVPDEERLGCESLAELVAYRSQALQQRITSIRTDLGELNSEIADVETGLSPGNLARLESLLTERLGELRTMWANRPVLAPPPESVDPAAEEATRSLRATIDGYTKQKATAETRRNQVRASVESARRVLALIDKIETDLTRLSVEYAEDFAKVGLTFEAVIAPVFHRDVVKNREAALTGELVKLREALDPERPESLAAKLKQSQDALRVQEAALSAPAQVYQAARLAHREFAESVNQTIGTPDTLDSIRQLRVQLKDLRENGHAQLASLESQRISKTEELFSELVGSGDLLRELYAPVQTFVDTNPPTDEGFRVAFAASLEAPTFESGLGSLVASNRKGSFYGAEQARARVERLLKDVEFNTWSSVRDFLESVQEALHADLRAGESNAQRDVSEQVRPGRTVADLYDYLFGLGYVTLRHRLTMGGRPLQQLSPGEKGALLLVFYLLVDQSDCPLLIDQPEENLDNQSVFSILVPFIKEARKRRQVILVTHNPNIAVVAGAEQVIFCQLNKPDKFRLSYEPGALENPKTNQHVVNVLEGTRPAFSDRREKYEVSARTENGAE